MYTSSFTRAKRQTKHASIHDVIIEKVYCYSAVGAHTKANLVVVQVSSKTALKTSSNDINLFQNILWSLCK